MSEDIKRIFEEAVKTVKSDARLVTKVAVVVPDTIDKEVADKIEEMLLRYSFAKLLFDDRVEFHYSGNSGYITWLLTELSKTKE